MNYAEAISSFQKIMLICLQIFLGFQIFTAIVKTSWAVRKINLLELWKYSKERVHDETNLQLLPRFLLMSKFLLLFLPGTANYHYFNRKTKHCVKSVRIWKFSGPYFPAFGLYPASLSTQSECRKIRTRKTLNMDTFHAVGHFW